MGDVQLHAVKACCERDLCTPDERADDLVDVCE
jgi:hypothetical protein